MPKILNINPTSKEEDSISYTDALKNTSIKSEDNIIKEKEKSNNEKN